MFGNFGKFGKSAAVAPALHGSPSHNPPLIFGSNSNKLILYKVTDDNDENLEVSIIRIQNSQGNSSYAICIFNKNEREIQFDPCGNKNLFENLLYENCSNKIEPNKYLIVFNFILEKQTYTFNYNYSTTEKQYGTNVITFGKNGTISFSLNDTDINTIKELDISIVSDIGNFTSKILSTENTDITEYEEIKVEPLNGGKKKRIPLEKCTVVQLKEKAKKRKICVTGLKKAEIIDKLRGKRKI